MTPSYIDEALTLNRLQWERVAAVQATTPTLRQRKAKTLIALAAERLSLLLRQQAVQDRFDRMARPWRFQ